MFAFTSPAVTLRGALSFALEAEQRESAPSLTQPALEEEEEDEDVEEED